MVKPGCWHIRLLREQLHDYNGNLCFKTRLSVVTGGSLRLYPAILHVSDLKIPLEATL